MARDLALGLLTVCWGLGALLPVARRLGAPVTAAASVPVGLVCWPMAAAVHSLTWTPFAWWLTPLFGSLAAMLLALMLRAVAGADGDASSATARTPRSNALRGSGLAAAAAIAITTTAGVTAAVSSARTFMFTPDSWGGYASTAIRLADTGVLFERVMSERAALIPAMTAGYRAFGGEWLFTIYPVVAVAVLALLGAALLRAGQATRSIIPAALGSTAAVIGLAAHPFFLLNSLYVHSHMLTAAYVLLGTVAIAFALREAEWAWLAVAGLAAAGIVLARPDGFIYALVLLLGGGVVALRFLHHERRAVLSLFVPHLTLCLLVFGAAFVRNGIWSSTKLSGPLAVAMLASHLALGAAFWGLASSPRGTKAVARHGLLTLAGLAVLGVVGLSAVIEGAPDVAATMLTNLLREGQWGVLWYLVPAIVGLSALASVLDRDDAVLRISTWTVPMFLAAAFAVHATQHPGRLGWTDSFNRIAFHVVPVVFLCVGAIIAWAARTLTHDEDGKVDHR